MIRGLKSKFTKSSSSLNIAAGSGAQGASVINTSKATGDASGEAPVEKAAAPAETAASSEPAASSQPQALRTEASSSRAIVAAEPPAGNGWDYEDAWSYIDSLGVTRTPGEEHILRFLADCLHASPLPAPWAMHRDGDGRIFYGNASTGETSWLHPLEEIVRELAGVCRVCVTLSRPMRERSIADLREAWEAQAKQEFSLWYSVKDSSTGNDYFCNSQTGQTMWEHPAEVLLPGHFLKLRAADRLVDDEYLQGLANLGSTMNAASGQTWNSMKRTLESGISTRASNDVKDDAHQAMKEELASTATELRAAREDAAKVKAEFEALKQRFEEVKRTAEEEELKRSKAEAKLEDEQQKLMSVQKDLAKLKEQFEETQRSAQDVDLKRSEAEAKLEEEQQKLKSAIAECEALKKQKQLQEAQAANESNTEADAQAAIRRELAATTDQLKAAQENAAKVQTDLDALKEKFDEAQRSAQDVDLKRSEAEAKLEEEQQKLKTVMAECEALKEQQQASNETSADAQTAMQQELAATTDQLKSAQDDAAKVKADCEALKERLAEAQRNADAVELQRAQAQEKLQNEQQRLQSAITECEAWKAQATATKDGQEQGMKMLEQILSAELETERKRTAELQQKLAEHSSNQASEAAATSELRRQLESQKEAEASLRETVENLQAELEQQKASSSSSANTLSTTAKELEATTLELQTARENAEKVKEEFDALKERYHEAQRSAEEVEQKRALAEEKLAAEQSRLAEASADGKKQLEDELERQRAAETVLRATMQGLQEELAQEKARAAEAATKYAVASQGSEASAASEATKQLVDELERQRAAEAALRTTMQSLQEELAQEKARAAEAAAKYAAASQVREAAIQEVDSVESQTRHLREEMEAQLAEERKRARDLEAKYEALRDAHETAVRVFAENVGAKQEAPAATTVAEGTLAGQALQFAIQEALGKEKLVREGLLKDQERLEQTTKSLQQQMQQVHAVASQLEAKVQESTSKLDAAEGERRELVQTVVAADVSQADQALRKQIETARLAERELELKAAAAKASLEDERGRVEQLKLEYTNLLQGQQDMVKASQRHLETKLEELGSQMREMRATLESRPPASTISRAQEMEIARQLEQVSKANAKLETAVAQEARSLGPPTPISVKETTPVSVQEAALKDMQAPRSPKRTALKEPTLPAKRNGKEPRIREFHGKMWARTDDAVLTGQRVRHLMLESLAARQQTRMYKEMIQEFDASESARKVKLSHAQVSLKELNTSLREQVEQARRELAGLEEKANKLGRAAN